MDNSPPGVNALKFVSSKLVLIRESREFKESRELAQGCKDYRFGGQRK